METKVQGQDVSPNDAKRVLPAVFCREEEELIANYMGEGAIGGYHQSWDWLMPVVVKINSNGFYFFWEDYVVKICRWSDGSGSISRESFLKGEDAFKAVYKCVVDFLRSATLSSKMAGNVAFTNVRPVLTTELKTVRQ